MIALIAALTGIELLLIYVFARRLVSQAVLDP